VVKGTYGVRRYIDVVGSIRPCRDDELIGTWAAADWAIRFYRRHGFELVTPERKTAFLERYWTIPERQVETSVVLADPPFGS
jgi:hypothetical protein